MSPYKEVGPGVATGRSGTIGKVHNIAASHYWPHNTSLFVKDLKGNDQKFVLHLLESVDLKSLGERTAAVPSLGRNNAHRIKVSLPPPATQQAIVAEIEAEQALVAANRELIDRICFRRDGPLLLEPRLGPAPFNVVSPPKWIMQLF
jgi:restriction endonuclease S subunit